MQCLPKQWKTFNIPCSIFLKAQVVHQTTYVLPCRLYVTIIITTLYKTSSHLLGMVQTIVIHILAILNYTNEQKYLSHFQNVRNCMQFIFCKDILEFLMGQIQTLVSSRVDLNIKLSTKNLAMGRHQRTRWCSSQGVIDVPPLHHVRHKIICIFHQIIYFPGDGDVCGLWRNWCSWLPEKILSLSGSFSISAYGTSLHTTDQVQ
jgi:hypothetical protein